MQLKFQECQSAIEFEKQTWRAFLFLKEQVVSEKYPSTSSTAIGCLSEF